MTVLVNVVLPVFLVAGLGVAAQLYLRLDARTLSRAAFYLFAPSLVFDSLVSSDVSGAESGQIAAALLLTTLALWGLGILAARLLRLEGPSQATFLAAVLIMNAGNYGLPVSLFAFGDAGLARASLYFTMSAMISSSLGVYLHARGRASTWLALRRVASVPLTYAAILGLAINLAHLTVPEPLQKAVHLMGQASIPTMLLVLGANLAETFRNRRRSVRLPTLAVVTSFRLLLAPTLAWLAAWGVGLQGLSQQVVVLQTAMPTAVITTILANEFDSDAPLAALCVLATTLASLLTVTLLLNWLV